MQSQGAYILFLYAKRSLKLKAGALKSVFLPSGLYAYVGSARGGIAPRIARHTRMAKAKSGKLHWHIDYLLAHPGIQLTGVAALPGCCECAVSRQIALQQGVTIPVPRFGSTDCRAGCRAHLYHVSKKRTGTLKMQNLNPVLRTGRI